MALAAPTALTSPATKFATLSAAVTSDSFTPTANALILVVGSARIGSGTAPAAFSFSDNGAGLSWTEEVDGTSANGSSPSARQTIWSAVAPSSPSAMTVTVDSDGNINGVTVLQVTGANSSITNVGTNSNSAGDPSPSISSPATASLVLGVATFAGANSPTSSPLANELAENQGSSLLVEVRYTLTSGPSSGSWASTNARSVGQLLEIAEGDTTLVATGFANTNAFGAATVSHGLTATGYADADAFGAASVGHGLTATGFANTNAFGSASVGHGLTATGYSDADAFGAAAVSLGLTAAGYANANGFGAAVVSIGLTASGVASTTAFGAAAVGHILTAAGFANTNAFGAAVVDAGAAEGGGAGGNPMICSLGRMMGRR